MLKVLRQKQEVSSHSPEWQDAFCSVRIGESLLICRDGKTIFVASEEESFVFIPAPARYCLLRQKGKLSVSHPGAVT